MKNKQDSSEVDFSEKLKSPCKVFHGTSFAFENAQMKDQGKGLWFTRHQIDAENYTRRGAVRTQGTPQIFEAWVRMEKVLDLGSLYDEATDEVLSELAHDSHVRLDVLFQLRANCRKDGVLEPYLFEITNNAEVVHCGFRLLIDNP